MKDNKGSPGKRVGAMTLLVTALSLTAGDPKAEQLMRRAFGGGEPRNEPEDDPWPVAPIPLWEGDPEDLPEDPPEDDPWAVGFL